MCSLGVSAALPVSCSTGLQKLVDATAAINELSLELAAKETELETATRKADQVLVEVTASAQAAEAVKTQVQKVKDKAQKLVDDIAVRSTALLAVNC